MSAIRSKSTYAARKCLLCPDGRNCINGKYCIKYKRYVQHMEKLPCE
nr:MAG TPA: ADAM cysteine-rich domain protein [Caudoviricetes sp.]